MARFLITFIAIAFLQVNSWSEAATPTNSIKYQEDEEDFSEFDNVKPVIGDKYEKINRKIFAFNMFVDEKFLLPITVRYIKYTSKDARIKINNVIANLYTPSNTIISAIQLDSQATMVSFWRFVINSSIGIFGIFDIATKLDLKPAQRDISDILAKLNAPLGQYIVLPFLGPTFSRNVINLPTKVILTSNFQNNVPLSYRFLNENTIVADILRKDRTSAFMVPLTIIDTRATLLPITSDMDQNSIDRYSTYRDMYVQYAQYEISKRLKENKEGIYPPNKDGIYTRLNLNESVDYCINDLDNSHECKTFSNVMFLAS